MSQENNKKTRDAAPENEMSQSEIDSSLEDSFPASDPPSWTLGTNHGRKTFSDRENPSHVEEEDN